MILSGRKLVFDLDGAAQAVYEIVRGEGGEPRAPWDELSEQERGTWHRAAAGAVAAYDPHTFGAVITEARRFWKIVAPVALPYFSIIQRPHGKTYENPSMGDGGGRRDRDLPL